MNSSTIDIKTPDGEANAYLARPDGARHPGVLLLMDAFGLRPTIEEMADRVAHDGYIVLAPNVFYRSGPDPVGPLPDMSDPDARASFFGQLRPLFAQLTPAAITADAGAYLDCLVEAGAEGPAAITGYCMGGRLGWQIAAAYPDRVAALGAFHAAGLVSEDPGSLHHLAGRVQAELVFGFADNDQNMTREQIAQFERALDDAGATYRSDVYEGAAHGYTMKDTPAYNEQARERHFRELSELLNRSLGVPSAG